MEGGEKAVEDKLVDASATSLHIQGSHETIRHDPPRQNHQTIIMIFIVNSITLTSSSSSSLLLC
jgi:hypothetical protein